MRIFAMFGTSFRELEANMPDVAAGIRGEDAEAAIGSLSIRSPIPRLQAEAEPARMPPCDRHSGEVGMSTDQDVGSQSFADPLPGLRRRLAEEYGEDFTTETIERVAEQSLGEFQGARVREFVSVFAWRRARERLPRAS
jgi:hypothetical protein